MTDKITWHRYCDIRLFREGEGWKIIPSQGLLHAPHGAYGAVILDWEGEGEPPVAIEPHAVNALVDADGEGR